MTPATIERLASEAGIWLFEDLPQVEATIGTLRIFAGLIAAHERERCAKVCEAAMPNPTVNWADLMIVRALEASAAAIRAL